MSDNILPDNTVVPSYLGYNRRGRQSSGADALVNIALRYGEVKKIHYPDDSLNQSKQVPEYEVEVQHRDGIGIATTTLYRGVVAVNTFGGIGDRTEITYRADTSKATNKPGNGSKVLLLCVSGDQQRAVILGGLSSVKSTDKTHHYLFEFNGFRFHVNADGECEFRFQGKTDNDGEAQGSEDASGSFIKLDKEGSVTVSGPGGEQYFKINNAAKTVEMRADTEWQVQTGAIDIKADSDVRIDSKAAMSLTASDGVQIGLATNAMLLADAYRQAEGLTNQANSKAFITASTAATTAAGAMTTAAGLLAIPMVGGIAAAPFLITAATQMGIIAAALNIAGNSLNSFENGYNDYLSPNNRND
jgi:hypothetical protein